MTIKDITDITSFKWATVTAVGPLRVKLDGDTAALLLTPETMIDPALLSVNDRVRVELSLRKIVVHGKAGGDGYYTPAALNGGQLDTRYYTQPQVDALVAASSALITKRRITPVAETGCSVASQIVTFNGVNLFRFQYASATYPAYEFEVEITSSSSAGFLNGKFRTASGGTDLSTTYLGGGSQQPVGGSYGALPATTFMYLGRTATTGGRTRFIVYNPMLAKARAMMGDAVDSAAGMTLRAWCTTTTGTYDSITMYFDSTFTGIGTVKVWGLL